MPHHDKIDYCVDEIRRYIEDDGRTQQWVADKLAQELDPRVTAKGIYKVCRKHGIHCQRTGPRAAEGHPEWQGGRIVSKSGYVKIFCPEHPTCVAVNQRRLQQADGAYYRKQKYVWEHRLIMEKALGRFLTPQEVVHHLNGVKTDNRLENLVLFGSNAEHLAYDLAGKCPKWSEEGKASIREASAKAASTTHLKAKYGVLRHQQIPDHLTAERDALAQRVLQTGVPLRLQPDFVHPKRKRCEVHQSNQSSG